MKPTPYPAYKPSGVEWLGDVPSHWEVWRLKHVARLNPARTESRNSLMLDTPITFLPMERVRSDGRIDPQEILLAYKVWNGFTYFRRNDVLVAKITPCFENGKGAHLHSLPTEIGFGSTEFHVLRAKSFVLPHFLYLLTRVSDFRRLGADAMTGAAGQQRVPSSFIANYSIPLPPLPEQTTIVRYLNHVDERINRYISAKQRHISLLKEQRQAVIHRAVTRGLDPNVRLKPSGVEWLGEIPAHWESRRLKTIGRIRYGLGQPPRELTDGLPLIRATNVDHGHIIEKDLMYVDPSTIPEGRDAILREKEIIVVRSGAYTADSAIIPKAFEGAVTGYDMVVTITKAVPEFIAMALLCAYVRDDQLIVESTRSAQPHLNAEELGTSLLLLPPLDEQSAIVEYLDKVIADIDAAINRAHHEIDLLKEYRTRLTADVVTGKLDVREAAFKLPDAQDELSISDKPELQSG